MSKWAFLFLLVVLVSSVVSQSYEENEYEDGEYEDVGDLDELFSKLKEDDYSDLLEKLKNQRDSELNPEDYNKNSDESLDGKDDDDENQVDDILNVEFEEVKESEQFDDQNTSSVEKNESVNEEAEQYYEEKNNEDDETLEQENSKGKNFWEESVAEEIIEDDNLDQEAIEDNIQENNFSEENEEAERIQNDDFDEEINNQANNFNDDSDVEANIESNFYVDMMVKENNQDNLDKTNIEDDSNEENVLEKENNFNNDNEENLANKNNIEEEIIDEISNLSKDFDEDNIEKENVFENDNKGIKTNDNNDIVNEDTVSESKENSEKNIDKVEKEGGFEDSQSNPLDTSELLSSDNDNIDEVLDSEIKENDKDYVDKPIGDENLNGNAPLNDYDPNESGSDEFDDANKYEKEDESADTGDFNEMVEILKMLGQLEEDNYEDTGVREEEEEGLKTKEFDDNIENKNLVDLAADEQFEQNPLEIPTSDEIETVEFAVETKQELTQLTSKEINDKINDFIQDYNDEIIQDFESSDNIPINIKLSLDEAVVITSPNYPEPYGGNSIVDWYFDGEGGKGIEFNITDFAVDGNSGDYLLVKPGQADDSGNDGIVFSYILRHERRYRFLDVDNMFVRFESKGNNFQNFKGFQFSVKFIEPKVDRVLEPEPLPEASVQAPEETLSVHLVGFRRGDHNLTEAFRTVLVDMAAMYLNKENIQMGDLSLEEAVQITGVSACNVNWPNHQNCSVVTFGIPVTSGDEYQLTTEQLLDLWLSFSTVDPAATRLRLLGISRYEPVNETLLLSIWWVMTFSGVLLVVVVGFILFRSQCFSEYNGMTRLREDTESLGARKSNLSLYPTPHQNLSPMFADGKFDSYLDGDYTPGNDTTRVDMGGAFTNKSFVRDGELMDLDSDEEIIMSLPDDDKAKRQSYTKTGLRPKDLYDV